MLKKSDFKKAAALLLNQPELETKSKAYIINEVCLPKSAELIRIWNDGKQADYSFYDAPEYVYDLLVCYELVSKRSILGFMNYLKDKKVSKYRELSIFEDYNGVGLSTVDLLLNGFTNVSFYNSDAKQLKYFKEMCKLHGVDSATRIVKRPSGESYDVVISLETAEHFVEPIVYLEGLKQMMRKGTYFVYGHCFRAKPASGAAHSAKDKILPDDEFPGHFSKYSYNGEQVSDAKMAKIVRAWLKENFNLVFKGFNGKPEIFKNK